MPRFVDTQSRVMELCKQRDRASGFISRTLFFSHWQIFLVFLNEVGQESIGTKGGSAVVYVWTALLFNWSFGSVVFIEFLKSKFTAMVLNASCIRSPRGLVVMHPRAIVGMDQWQAAVCPLSGGQTSNTQLSFRSFSLVTFRKPVTCVNPRHRCQ